VEPLGDGRVNWCRGEVGGGRDGSVGGIILLGESRRVWVGDVADRDIAGRGFAVDETAPGFMGLVDNLHGVLLVLSLAREGELVFGLSVGDLVNPEPLVGSSDETRQVTLDILDVVQLGGERVVGVDYEDFPVGLALIEKGHDAENLDLFDLADITDLFTDLANIEGIVVTLGLGLRVGVVGVLPGLRECTVVPDVAVVGEAVANETQTTLLDVLFDGVEWFLLGDLELGVGPTGDLYNHVEDAIVLVGKESNVVEGGDCGSVLFRIDAVFEGVGRADGASSELGNHRGG
jgi:hypothetical protein